MKKWNYENEQWTKLPSHLKHLPLFTQHFDLFSRSVKLVWAFILKFLIFKFYIRLKVIGDFKKLTKDSPKLLLISNHGSHLDATSIAAAVPMSFWSNLFVAAAKDYFFSNPVFSFFSKHCLGAIPIDRKDKKNEAIRLCLNLLKSLDKIWLILFPEGTRSTDGQLQKFRRGVSLFARSSKTPLLFLYLDGNTNLWPKGQFFAKPGQMKIFVGPVCPPGKIDEIYTKYTNWLDTIKDQMDFPPTNLY